MTEDNTGASTVIEDTSLADDILSQQTPKEEVKGEEQKPEAKTEEKPKEGEEKVEKLVSLSALHEERERRKDLQRKLEAQEERSNKLEERTNRMLEAMAASKQPAEQEFVDPLKKLEDEVSGLKQTIHKSQEQIDADNKTAREEQALVDRYKGSADAFAKEKPDFMEARTYLINTRIEELQLMGRNSQEITQEIKALEKQIVEDAYKREANPAEIVYKLAEKRGYKVSAKEETKKPDKTVEDIDKGLKASKSLSSSGSGQDSDGDLASMSAEDIAELSNEEFDSYWKKFEKRSRN